MSNVSPLQSNILSLAQSEYDTDRPLCFFEILSRCPKDTQILRIILAADSLIGYLFTYGAQFVSIGEQYFTSYIEDYPRYVVFNWCRKKRAGFCDNCYLQEWSCNAQPFSSQCIRFRIAWAIEHIAADTNLLIHKLVEGGTS